MTRTLITLLFFILSNNLFSQDFYINQKGDITDIDLKLKNGWERLNLQEANLYLSDAGFGDIALSEANNMVVVSGCIKNPDFRFYRKLYFKDGVITEVKDNMLFIQPCLLCLINQMRDKITDPNFKRYYTANGYKESKNDDTKNKDEFYERYNLSLISDGINDGLNGDITDYSFHFVNKIDTTNFVIVRDCEMHTEDNISYNFNLGKSIKLKEKEYYVGTYNLNTVNKYDLNLMIDVFLLDCKLHNIPVKKSKVYASFVKLNPSTLGLSYGINDDTKITLKIDPENWEKASIVKRWYLIYHELGHDVLNLKHGNGGKMMFTFADKSYSWDDFINDKNYMFNAYKKLKK
jgi:hypothetical protein